MLFDRVTVRPAEQGDLPQIALLRAEAFSLSSSGPVDAETLDPQHRWVAECDGTVHATASATPLGQWVAGRVVPSLAVRSVAVSAGARGSGIGARLVTTLLNAARDRGSVLACLFPSVVQPYRRAGFELTGSWTVYGAPAAEFPLDTAADVLTRWDDDDLDAVADCYDRAHSTMTGPLARAYTWWRSEVLREHESAVTYRWLVREGGVVTGYLVYRKVHRGDRDLGDYVYDVEVRDVAYTTPEASRALLTHLAGHRGLGVVVRWPGPPGDPWLLALGGRVASVERAYVWMLRALDPIAALEARGWSPAVAGQIALGIHGPEPGAMTGLRLSVTDGAAQVSPEPAPSVELDVGAFSSLYAGFSRATDLARTGRLRGAGPAELQTLDSLFAGPPPWLPEQF